MSTFEITAERALREVRRDSGLLRVRHEKMLSFIFAIACGDEASTYRAKAKANERVVLEFVERRAPNPPTR